MNNNRGFTLIEILAVLTILGILAAAGVYKFMQLDNSAVLVVLRDAVTKTNTVEMQHWTNVKLSEGYKDDDQIFQLVKPDLVNLCNWQEISSTGGTISMKGNILQLERVPSSVNQYAIWKEVSSGG
jgi:prepilin-type N-terminal cleavage/methylation domain-containing protein